MRTKDVLSFSLVKCFTSSGKLFKIDLLCIANTRFIISYFHPLDGSSHLGNTPILILSGWVGFKSQNQLTMRISLLTSSRSWILEELMVDCIIGFVFFPCCLNTRPFCSFGITRVQLYLFLDSPCTSLFFS